MWAMTIYVADWKENKIGNPGCAEDCLLSSVHKTPSSWWREGKRGITVDNLTHLPPTPQKKDITWSTGRRWWQALKEERATRSRLLKEVCTTAQLLVLRRELKNLKIPKSNLHAAALEICWRIWGEGGGGREGGGEEAFLSLQWSLPPQWSWRAYTVELTQPRSHWRQPGTYCTALYHQPPFLINVQIVSSNQYYVEKSHTVCTLFPWDIASNTAIKNLFPELGDGVKSPKLLMFTLHILAFEAYNSLSWKMSTKIWILTFWVLNSCVFNTSLIVI